MTVDPDEILIFKMRGMKSTRKKAEKPQPRQAVRPVQVKRSEAGPRRPLFAQKPKPSPSIPAPKTFKPAAVEAPEETPARPYDQEDETRMRQLEDLEQKVSLFANPPTGLEAEQGEAQGVSAKTELNAFSMLAALLFIVNAFVFSYFILPQSGFVIGYILNNGLGSLVLNGSYEYGTSLINIILALLSALSGVLMLAKVDRSHMLGGATGSMMLLAISFEYLNSSATYLLLVSVITFVSIVALAYARMSAVSILEKETPAPAEVNWPRIETF